VYAQPTIRESTYESYELYVRKHINPTIGECRLKSLKNNILQKFFNEKLENGRLDKKGGLSVKTVSNMKNMLHEALEQAIINELIVKNPLKGVRLPKQKKREMRVLDLAEQEALVEKVMRSEEVVAQGIILALDSGMRIGEVLGLQWSKINFNNNSYVISKSLARRKKNSRGFKNGTVIDIGSDPNCKTALVLGDTKTGNKETEYMTERFRNALLKLKKYNDDLKRIMGKSFNKYDFVIFNERGNPIEPRTYEDIFDRYAEKAGIENASFHSLRHTFATRIIEKGCDAKTLSKLMRHAQPSTSMNMYVHTFERTKQNAISLLN
jgi:integrase